MTKCHLSNNAGAGGFMRSSNELPKDRLRKMQMDAEARQEEEEDQSPCLSNFLRYSV